LVRGQHALAALSVLLGSLVVGSLATKQVDPEMHLRTHSLNLSRPHLVLTDPAAAAESHLAPMAWTGSGRFGLRFGDLHRFDVVKLKLLAECGSTTIDLLLDGRRIGTVTANNSWREHTVYLPREGRVLALERREPRPCPIDISRAKSINAVGYSSTFPEGYVLYDPRPYVPPSPLRAPGPATFLEVLAFCLALLVADWLLFRGNGVAPDPAVTFGLLAGAGVLLTFEVIDLAGSLRVVYPLSTLWAILATAGACGWSLARRRELFAASRTANAAARRLAEKLPPGVAAVLRHGLDPAPDAGSRATLLAALGAYAAFLVASLPRTPFEWDEVLFLRALTHYDIAAHSPHPPGYPLFVAAERLAHRLGAVPVHAPQLASAAGALLAVIFLPMLARRFASPRFPAVVAAVLLCAIPAFAFNANAGLSDALATGITVAAAWGLVRYLDKPGSHREAAAAGALAAFAAGVRPQVILALAGLVVWALARSLKRRQRTALAFGLSGTVVGAACWIPPVLITGWHRYWSAVRLQGHWLENHEAAVRLPRLAFDSAVRAWLVQPFGTSTASYAFWLLVAVGSWCWWHSGRRRLVAAMLLCGGGYLLLAPWIMAADTSVRYALPALPFLATLAAGVLVSPRPARRLALSTLLIGVVLGMAAWVMPVLAQRSAEDAPVWAGLEWVRVSCSPRRTTLVASGVILPHAQYILGRAGYKVIGNQQTVKVSTTVETVAHVLSPAEDTGCAAVFSDSWTSPRMWRLSRRRYLSCAVFVTRRERNSGQSGDP
jgi:hypothetical protein